MRLTGRQFGTRGLKARKRPFWERPYRTRASGERPAGRHSGRGRRLAVAAAAVSLALAITSCGQGKASGPHVVKPVAGGAVTYALPADVAPNYIFPFASSQYFSIVNFDDLQYLMYRPLYWYGDGKLPYLNKRLSLADPPVYRGRTVTIKLKSYKWSDGETLNAGDVLFWVHMMQAVGAKDWGGYVPGDFPDDISSIRAVGSNEVRMVIKGKYSRLWFTDNELSQITPMPRAWDLSGAAHPSDCTHDVADCAAVFSYLSSLATNPRSWSASPVWTIVDGPWRLSGYNSQGDLTFSYNRQYSGPAPKDHISKFMEIPFTSEIAEYNVLQAGGSNRLDVGYLPTVDAPVPPPGATVGQNPVSGYHLQPLYTWGLSYFPYNFGPADKQRAIIGQFYFRKAFQLLVNQAAIIQGPLHGYGKLTSGVVGSYPVTKYLSPLARQGDPFPYDPDQARSLLASHGWKLVPGHDSTCVAPGTGHGECGAGVAEGAKLNFTLVYATGNAWEEAALLQLKSNASEIGINIELIPKTFDGVLQEIIGDCGSGSQPCPWELADWGQGWSYVPDYLPTGDELFQTNSAGNLGHYSNEVDDRLIAQTLRNSSLSAMWKWENYLTKQQLPVVLQPSAPAALIESIGNLRIGQQSPTLAITPEDWYYAR